MKTPGQIRAGKWIIAYFGWFCCFLEWNTGAMDNALPHNATEMFLFLTLIALLVIAVIQIKGGSR